MAKQSTTKKAKSVRVHLTPRDRVALQLESGCSQGSISKFIAGAPLRDATLRRLEKACAELGFEVVA